MARDAVAIAEELYFDVGTYLKVVRFPEPRNPAGLSSCIYALLSVSFQLILIVDADRKLTHLRRKC